MKKITQLLTALVFCSLMIFVSCNKGGGDDPKKTDARIEIGNNLVTVASGTPSSVTLDGAARTEWDAFGVTFTFVEANFGGNYTVSGVPTNEGASAVWGGSGTWTFDEAGTKIMRSDNVDMTATISASAVTVTFNITGSGTRTAAFDGEWKFTW